MARRRYRQHCAVAKSLDVVGERWALLIVRDLLDGPQRYVDLLDNLATIPTDTLAARLRDLESQGLVERHRLAPPADRVVYQLTDVGRDLEPVVDAYARWGMRLIEERDPDDVMRPRWLARAVRTLLRPDRTGVDVTLALRTPDGDTTLHITDDRVDLVDPDEPAAVTLTGAVDDLLAALDPARAADLVADGRVAVEGDRDAVRQVAGSFAGPP